MAEQDELQKLLASLRGDVLRTTRVLVLYAHGLSVDEIRRDPIVAREAVVAVVPEAKRG